MSINETGNVKVSLVLNQVSAEEQPLEKVLLEDQLLDVATSENKEDCRKRSYLEGR